MTAGGLKIGEEVGGGVRAPIFILNVLVGGNPPPCIPGLSSPVVIPVPRLSTRPPLNIGRLSILLISQRFLI